MEGHGRSSLVLNKSTVVVEFYPAVTWDTGLINISVPSYSRVNLLPPLYSHMVFTDFSRIK